MIIDLLIVILVLLAFVNNYHRGFVVVAAHLVGLVVAILAAAAFYHPLGRLLATSMHVFPPLANVAAYLIVLVMAEFILVLLLRRLLRILPHTFIRSPFNLLAGAFLGAIEMVLIIAIGLSVFVNLPLNSAQKQTVQISSLAPRLITLGNRLQSLKNLVPGSDLTETVNLLTVDPESHEFINLGFSTADVKVDEAAEARMLVLVNEERTSRGLQSLTLNVKARTVARAHSRDMFARGYFSHVTPEGVDPFQRMREGDVQFEAAGENIALAPTLDIAHNGLMNSPGHRANILSPDYSTVGIGIIDGGPYGLMITQDFTN